MQQSVGSNHLVIIQSLLGANLSFGGAESHIGRWPLTNGISTPLSFDVRLNEKIHDIGGPRL
jgi:hypothetical protein